MLTHLVFSGFCRAKNLSKMAKKMPSPKHVFFSPENAMLCDENCKSFLRRFSIAAAIVLSANGTLIGFAGIVIATTDALDLESAHFAAKVCAISSSLQALSVICAFLCNRAQSVVLRDLEDGLYSQHIQRSQRSQQSQRSRAIALFCFCLTPILCISAIYELETGKFCRVSSSVSPFNAANTSNCLFLVPVVNVVNVVNADGANETTFVNSQGVRWDLSFRWNFAVDAVNTSGNATPVLVGRQGSFLMSFSDVAVLNGALCEVTIVAKAECFDLTQGNQKVCSFRQAVETWDERKQKTPPLTSGFLQIVAPVQKSEIVRVVIRSSNPSGFLAFRAAYLSCH
jgi:hypothetical protein